MINGESTYSFNFKGDGISGTPEFVAVAPVYSIENRDEVGEITSRVEMPVRTASVTPDDEAESEENKVVGGGTTQVSDSCGDGIVDAFESCDDGNANDGDGCSSDCRIE